MAVLHMVKLLKLLEIHIVEFVCGSFVFKAVGLDVVQYLLKSFGKLLEILLVQENLVLVICEITICVHPALAFSDRQGYQG